MTQKEIYKLKLMSKLETTMTLRELEKWSCFRCKKCYRGECAQKRCKTDVITFNVFGMKYRILTCFESKKE